MKRRAVERDTVVRKLRVLRSDEDALDRVAASNDISRQEAMTRLLAFAASIRDDAALAYILGLVPRSLKAEARERLIKACEANDSPRRPA